MKKKRFILFRWVLSLLAAGAAAALVVAFAVVLLVAPTLPSVQTLRDVQLKVPLRVYSADAKLIAEFGEERRLPVQIADVPQALIDAILAAEDDSFYTHRGVDLMGIVRAAIANVRSGVHGQGASTITMQVARNYFLSPEKTYTRKVKEILLAFKIERELTKGEILELYLNKIFLGHRAYGFAAAAQVYYNKPLAELSIAESAMLAGLPKAPSRNNPISNPETATQRRDYVLNRMLKLGSIDEVTHAQAVSTPLTAGRHEATVEAAAPYVAEIVRQHMIDTYGQAAYEAGFQVHTTVDSRHQAAAVRALRDGLLAYERRHGYRGAIDHMDIDAETSPDQMTTRLEAIDDIGDLVPAVALKVADKSVTAYIREGELAQIEWEGLAWARRRVDQNAVSAAPNKAADIVRVGDIIYIRSTDAGWQLAQRPEISGAVVSIRPNDGAIMALTGGYSFYESKFNRVTQAQRQPGSNLKPFIYSAALERGFTAASRISGAPIVIEDVSVDAIWRPENYSGKFFGPTRLREALRLSLNLVSIRLLRAIGPGFAVDHLSRFGFDREKLPRNLSLALGTASLTPLELVAGYAVFANDGYMIEPYLITRIVDQEDSIVHEAGPLVVCPDCPEPAAEPSNTVVNPESAPRIRPAPRAISSENAFIMTSMMQDVINFGTGRRATELGRNDLAGKTGTTNDYHDAWFSGFNKNLVTTVWVGFDQPKSLGRHETGGRAALPIWIDYMRVALDGVAQSPRTPPANVTTSYISRTTGNPTDVEDPEGYEEFFIVGDSDGPDVGATESLEIQPPAEDAKIPEGLF